VKPDRRDSSRQDLQHRSRSYPPGHPFDWQLVQSTSLLQDRWLSLRADTCKLPNGRTAAPYYVLEYPSWVNVVALTPDDQVVLVRQYRHGIRQTVVELPAGTVEPSDASPLAAMQRELVEETGYAGEVWRETGRLSPNTANHTNLTYCFVATGINQVAEPVLDDTEQLETVLMPLTEMIDVASRGGLLQALHMASLFLALQALGRLRVT
jgi:ADP-ribose pyrophosphatase